jgi:hypothetical protein
VQQANGATYVPEAPETSQYHGAHGLKPADGYSAAETSSRAERIRRRRSNREPGLPGWAGVLVLLVIAGLGGLIDQISGASIQGAFNYGLVFASLVAILAVKRGQMFSVVIAPPLVYFLASAVKLYITSGGLKNRSVLTDAAANWLVYGFPAIAGATAVVLVIAGIRLIIRR